LTICDIHFPESFLKMPESEHLIDLDATPFVPYNDWEVAEHCKGGQFKWDASKVELYLSEEQREGKGIEGNKLREELKGKPVLNANVLDYLLENPHLIPEEWKGNRVFFLGTIYRAGRGDLRVRCLCWGDGRWRWFYDWLDCKWSSRHPAAITGQTLAWP
jgi:hypothetical protein